MSGLAATAKAFATYSYLVPVWANQNVIKESL